ncbi:MAG: thermonuclease family protein [Pirellulaceae bacterium]
MPHPKRGHRRKFSSTATVWAAAITTLALPFLLCCGYSPARIAEVQQPGDSGWQADAPIEDGSAREFLRPETELAASNDADSPWLEGKVVSITDGDTLQVLVDERPVKVRLEGIDCPETGQPFGTAAKKHLASLCFGKQVRVRVTGQDRYGRTLGEVLVGDESANHALVRDGFSWHYKKYSSDAALAASEVSAREAKVGLWADVNPIPPWEWRDLSASERAARVANAPPREVEPRAPPAEGEPVARYWLNTSTGARHNSSCRWFGNTKQGRYCGPNEGDACGMCGG